MGLDPQPVSLSRARIEGDSYFTKFTYWKALFYAAVSVYVGAVSILSVLEPYLDLPCNTSNQQLAFSNPAFNANPCRQLRYAALAGFTPEECSYARRLLGAIILGGIIGWERRQADRPAGIRTMSLVSLGSCLFTINSMMAFLDGPMSWDASRVSAAIPSGVGFLGAGLIFKKEEKSEDGESTHMVHGLTTAASLWLSAAVGIACGGELFMAASFGTGLMLLLLRFGPRQRDDDDDDDDNNNNEYDNDMIADIERASITRSGRNYDSIPESSENSDISMHTKSQRAAKLKRRATLTTMT